MKTIKIKGMSCNHCVAAVTKALTAIDGVKNVQVDLGSGQATFDESESVASDTVRKAIKAAGYETE